MSTIVMARRLGRLLEASLMIYILTTATAGLKAQDRKNVPPNELMTTKAWEALNNEDYEGAIRRAAQCIKEFRRSAEKLQKELADKKVPLPGVGKVEPKEKEIILNRGPLNDVAACYFIQGEAYYELAARATGANKKSHLAKSKAAYEATARMTYARVYDKRYDGFWDPSAKANERLEDNFSPGSNDK